MRFDNTQLEGLRDTIGYLDARKLLPGELAQKILEKIRGKHIASDVKSKETEDDNEEVKSKGHLYSTITSNNIEIKLYCDY